MDKPDEENAQAIKDSLVRIWGDPLAFGEALGYKGTTDGRKQFGEFHRRMIDHVYSKARSSTIVPRGHAKSTVISVIDTCWHLLRQPESRNLIACATLDLAKKRCGEIRDRLNGDLEIIPGLFVPVREVFPWLSPSGDLRRSGPTEAFN